jgi:hypothetical protein
MIRTLVLATLAILACIYAIFRVALHEPAPHPAPSATESGEIPAPPLVPID